MIEFIPFKGWRYNEARFQDINQHFSPLFDVVNEHQRKQLYANPYNSIHLSVPASMSKAESTLDSWKKEEIIVQDPSPALYVYYQYFTLFGEKRRRVRRGIIGMVSLDQSEILLHENTMPHSVNDRVELLERIKMNVAPTHGLYHDTAFSIEPILDRYIKDPLYEYIDYQGVINAVSPIHDPKDIQTITDHLKEKKIYLADGHHRLESSYAFWNKKKSNIQSQNAIEGYHFMYLTNLASDDLKILPTHRLWVPRLKPDWGLLWEQIDQFFDATPLTKVRTPIYEILQPGMFGLVSSFGQWAIQLKPGLSEEISLDIPDVLKRLPYTQIHYFLFEKVLGIPYDEQHRTREIQYERDYAKAVGMVGSHDAELSIIMRDVRISDMMEICNEGAIMPPKSTFFYPKVVCGLVFASIDSNEN